MKQEEALEIREKIRESFAKYLWGEFTGFKLNLVVESRQNKGGSLTVPKSIVEEWNSIFNKSFSNLDKDIQEKYYRMADKMMLTMKTIIGIE